MTGLNRRTADRVPLGGSEAIREAPEGRRSIARGDNPWNTSSQESLSGSSLSQPRRGDRNPVFPRVPVAPPGLREGGKGWRVGPRGCHPWLLIAAPPGLKTAFPDSLQVVIVL